MNKILVGFFSMTLVLMLSMVSTTINVAEAASSHASSGKSHKHKKIRYSRKHRSSKKRGSKKSRHKKKHRRGGGGCQTLSSSTLHQKASPFNSSINSAAKKHGVSQNLIKAVITIESCFRSRARGSLGEKGLMQLMPKTARRLNVRNGYNVSQNVHGGAKYLGFLLRRYNGNMQRAIAAYNAGEGNIDKGRIPNQRYVNKVLHAYRKFSSGKSDAAYKPTKRKEKYRAKAKDTHQPRSKSRQSSQHTYKVKQGDTVYEVMRQTGTPVKKIIRLNGLQRPYHLQAGQSLQISGSSKAKKTSRRSTAARTADAYIVQSNDTIYKIMQQTGVPIEKIIRLNKLSLPYQISAGQELRLR